LGSGNLTNDGWFGHKRNFSYTVPPNALNVSMDWKDLSAGGWNIGIGNGEAWLSWTPGSETAKVFAWVNGKWYGTNEVSWTVWANIWKNS
jgi:hypothetical protein